MNKKWLLIVAVVIVASLAGNVFYFFKTRSDNKALAEIGDETLSEWEEPELDDTKAEKPNAKKQSIILVQNESERKDFGRGWWIILISLPLILSILGIRFIFKGGGHVSS